MKKIFEFKSKNSIFSLLLKAFFTASLLPMVIVVVSITFFFNFKYSNDINKIASSSVHLIANQIDSYFTSIEKITLSPFYHSYFQHAQPEITDDSILYISTFEEEMKKLLSLSRYSSEDLGDIIISVDKVTMFYTAQNWNEYFHKNNKIEEENWYNSAISNNGKLVIQPYLIQENNDTLFATSFYASRKIINLWDQEHENVIMCKFNLNFLNSLTTNNGLFISNETILLDQHGKFVYSSGPIDASLPKMLHSNRDKINYENSKWNVASQQFGDHNYTLYLLTSNKEVSQNTLIIVIACILIYFIGLCITTFFYYKFSKRIRGVLDYFINLTKSVELGNLSVRYSSVAIKEIDELGFSFNHMIMNLSEKIKNEYIMTINQKNIEFKALQSQIQPHFLFNIISSLVSLNELGKVEELNTALFNLSNLLRYVLSSISISSIKNELQFLDDYCALQKIRFTDKFEYSILCDSDINEVEIPKLLFQPLVENAILHGIEPKKEPSSLQIIINKISDNLHVIIQDNGMGFNVDEEKQGTHIGIENVKERLHLWDKAASMNIVSTIKEGTEINITLPIHRGKA